MNIFYLDKDPVKAAAYHCDKHCVKMILESAQLLSTAHRVLDGVQGIRVSEAGRNLKDWVLEDPYRETLLYKATHVNHPCAVWVRQNKNNYFWLESLLSALYNEYTARYKRIHLTQRRLEDALVFAPSNYSNAEFTEPPQAMPDECKVPGDSVTAYRNYYLNHKSEIAVWNHSDKPYWWNK